ncbi:MAG TPA: membrane protein insertase YidC [Burkholderiaceae bacterium]|nr:membrane protein insertase YidC [Burkholderiaceae bacterium]
MQTQTQRTILWVIFTMSLLFLWDAWQRHTGQPSLFGGAPPKTQPADAPGAAPGPVGGPAGDASVPTPAVVPTPATPATAAAPAPGAPATSQQAIVLQNDVLSLQIDPIGGTVKYAELLQHRDASGRGNQMLLQDQPGQIYLAQSGLIGPGGANFPTHRTPFQVVGQRDVSPGVKELRLQAESGGLRVTKVYTLERGSYVIGVRHELQNLTGDTLSPTLYTQLTRDANPPPGESYFYSTYTGPVVYTDESKFTKVAFSDIEKGKQQHPKAARDGWVGIIQHYFVSAWVPHPPDAPREFYTRRVDTNLYSVGSMQPAGSLAPGATATVESKLFVGPQIQDVLAAVAPGLELSVDYGWLTVFAKPLFWLLNALHSLVGNWGWAIVLLTIVVKLAFWPLQAASYRSMARMKKVTPRLMQIRERYGNDRMKMNQAMMELYKTEKINPLGGCLPIVVQIPVFIALYWVLLASVEMRNAPWVLWIQDLAVPDPYFILPLVMAGTMFIQVKLNPTPPDPMQAKMMMFMPLIFSVMFFFFPAGLVLYWLVNNVFSIGQQWVIMRRIEGKPVFGKAPA